MMVAGAAGFYLGIDLPPRNLNTSQEHGSGAISKADPVETLSALGKRSSLDDCSAIGILHHC